MDGCQLHRQIKMRGLLLQTDQLISLHQSISQSPSLRRTHLHTYTNVPAHAAGCLKRSRWICEDYLLDPVLSRDGRDVSVFTLWSRVVAAEITTEKRIKEMQTRDVPGFRTCSIIHSEPFRLTRVRAALHANVKEM